MAEPEKQPAGSGEDVSDGAETHRQESQALRSGRATGTARRSFVLLFAGLAAGMTGWGLVEVAHDTFEPEPLPAAPGASVMNPVFDPAIADAVHKARFQNALLSITLLGSSLGGWLALAVNVLGPRPSVPRALLSIVSGALAGAIFGALGTYAAFAVGDSLVNTGLSPMVRAYLAHGITWAILGVGVGLGISLSNPRWSELAANLGLGALAGLLSVLVYQVLASLLLPAENTTPVIPGSTAARVTWAVLSCGVMAVALAAKRGTDAHHRSQALS